MLAGEELKRGVLLFLVQSAILLPHTQYSLAVFSVSLHFYVKVSASHVAYIPPTEQLLFGVSAMW